jgi:hypothetical protein
MASWVRWIAAAFLIENAFLLYPHARNLIVRP